MECCYCFQLYIVDNHITSEAVLWFAPFCGRGTWKEEFAEHMAKSTFPPPFSDLPFSTYMYVFKPGPIIAMSQMEPIDVEV